MAQNVEMTEGKTNIPSSEEISMQSLTYLRSVMTAHRAKAMLEFALSQKIEDRYIGDAQRNGHPATEYAMHLICNASELLTKKDEETFFESICVISVMLALEGSYLSSWNPGSELLYDIRQAGIMLPRMEVAAFLASVGDSKRGTDAQRQLLMGDQLATVLYCSKLETLYGSLPGISSFAMRKPIPQELADKFNACWKSDPASSIEEMLQTFGAAALQDPASKRIGALTSWLRKYGFYSAPFDTTGPLACESGLAIHTANLISRHLQLQTLETEEDIGRIVLTDVLCSLEKPPKFKQTWSNKRIYCPEGNMAEPDGTQYRVERQVAYRVEDPMPFGAGRTSLHMANGILGETLPRDIACAIDYAPSGQEDIFTLSGQLCKYPLALTLRIANILATNLDDPNSFK